MSACNLYRWNHAKLSRQSEDLDIILIAPVRLESLRFAQPRPGPDPSRIKEAN